MFAHVGSRLNRIAWVLCSALNELSRLFQSCGCCMKDSNIILVALISIVVPPDPSALGSEPGKVWPPSSIV